MTSEQLLTIPNGSKFKKASLIGGRIDQYGFEIRTNWIGNGLVLWNLNYLSYYFEGTYWWQKKQMNLPEFSRTIHVFADLKLKYEERAQHKAGDDQQNNQTLF